MTQIAAHDGPGSAETMPGAPVTVEQRAPVAAPAPQPVDEADEPATPVPVGSPTGDPLAAIPDQVDLQRPELVVTPPEDADALDLYAAYAAEGVDHLSGASRFPVTVIVEGERWELTALRVDPGTFRPLTPSVTAQERGVWERLAEGEMVVRHDVAFETRMELGDTYEVDGPEGQREVRVGAFASNGAPPFADLIVPWQVGADLGAPDVNLLVLSVADGERPDVVGETIVEALGGGSAKVIGELEQRQAQIVQAGQRVAIEPFNYTDIGDGTIIIDPAWVRRWIVNVELPSLGRANVHRAMVPQLFAALCDVEDAGLAGHFKREQFAGVWVPRHIDWDPNKPLSMHAWGLAIDINSHDNWLGQQPKMDLRIVRIFESWGFNWGGWWSRPDGMHFELARVVDVPATHRCG